MDGALSNTSQMCVDFIEHDPDRDRLNNSLRRGVPGCVRPPGVVAFRVARAEQGKRGGCEGGSDVAEAGIVAEKQGHACYQRGSLQQRGVPAQVDTGQPHLLRHLLPVPVVRIAAQ